jgi:hypothetical protein
MKQSFARHSNLLGSWRALSSISISLPNPHDMYGDTRTLSNITQVWARSRIRLQEVPSCHISEKVAQGRTRGHVWEKGAVSRKSLVNLEDRWDISHKLARAWKKLSDSPNTRHLVDEGILIRPQPIANGAIGCPLLLTPVISSETLSDRGKTWSDLGKGSRISEKVVLSAKDLGHSPTNSHVPAQLGRSWTKLSYLRSVCNPLTTAVTSRKALSYFAKSRYILQKAPICWKTFSDLPKSCYGSERDGRSRKRFSSLPECLIVTAFAWTILESFTVFQFPKWFLESQVD